MPRSPWLTFALTFLVAPLFGVALLQGAEIERPVDLADLSELVEQLDADQFARRQAASDELSRRGSDAFPALEEAAKNGNREVAERSLEILETHFESDDTSTSQAAREVLERLAQDRSSRAGRLADEVLNPPPPIPPIQFGQRPVMRPQALRIAANIRQVAPRNVKRIHVRNENGVQRIEVEENGRKIKLTDDPKNGIELEVTETKNGKETTEKYAAKDADELKKKHPEAAKHYDEVAAHKAQIKVQIGNAAPAANPADVKERQIKSIERSLENLDKQIEGLRKEAVRNPAIVPSVENLERMRARLEEMKGRLEK